MKHYHHHHIDRSRMRFIKVDSREALDALTERYEDVIYLVPHIPENPSNTVEDRYDEYIWIVDEDLKPQPGPQPDCVHIIKQFSIVHVHHSPKPVKVDERGHWELIGEDVAAVERTVEQLAALVGEGFEGTTITDKVKAIDTTLGEVVVQVNTITEVIGTPIVDEEGKVVPVYDSIRGCIEKNEEQDSKIAALDEKVGSLDDLITPATSVVNAINAIDERLVEEKAERIEKDDELATAIEKETAERTLVDGQLADRITNEVAALEDKIEDETQARILVDEQLAEIIKEEANKRAFEDGKLADSIAKVAEDSIAYYSDNAGPMSFESLEQLKRLIKDEFSPVKAVPNRIYLVETKSTDEHSKYDEYISILDKRTNEFRLERIGQDMTIVEARVDALEEETARLGDAVVEHAGLINKNAADIAAETEARIEQDGALATSIVANAEAIAENAKDIETLEEKVEKLQSTKLRFKWVAVLPNTYEEAKEEGETLEQTKARLRSTIFVVAESSTKTKKINKCTEYIWNETDSSQAQLVFEKIGEVGIDPSIIDEKIEEAIQTSKAYTDEVKAELESKIIAEVAEEAARAQGKELALEEHLEEVEATANSAVQTFDAFVASEQHGISAAVERTENEVVMTISVAQAEEKEDETTAHEMVLSGNSFTTGDQVERYLKRERSIAATAVENEKTRATAAETAINDTIGVVETGKTVVGMIAEAKAAAMEAVAEETSLREAADAELQSGITALDEKANAISKVADEAFEMASDAIKVADCETSINGLTLKATETDNHELQLELTSDTAVVEQHTGKFEPTDDKVAAAKDIQVAIDNAVSVLPTVDDVETAKEEAIATAKQYTDDTVNPVADTVAVHEVKIKENADAISALANLSHFVVVNELPAEGDSKTIYLIKSTAGNYYEEWIYVLTTPAGVKEWVKLCDADIQLQNYYNKVEIDGKLAEQSTRIVAVETKSEKNKEDIETLSADLAAEVVRATAAESTINNTIGEVETGKTVVGMIADVKATAEEAHTMATDAIKGIDGDGKTTVNGLTLTASETADNKLKVVLTSDTATVHPETGKFDADNVKFAAAKDIQVAIDNETARATAEEEVLRGLVNAVDEKANAISQVADDAFALASDAIKDVDGTGETTTNGLTLTASETTDNKLKVVLTSDTATVHPVTGKFDADNVKFAAAKDIQVAIDNEAARATEEEGKLSDAIEEVKAKANDAYDMAAVAINGVDGDGKTAANGLSFTAKVVDNKLNIKLEAETATVEEHTGKFEPADDKVAAAKDIQIAIDNAVSTESERAKAAEDALTLAVEALPTVDTVVAAKEEAIATAKAYTDERDAVLDEKIVANTNDIKANAEAIEALASVSQFAVVNELPAEGDSNTIYLLKKDAEGEEYYEEWVYVLTTPAGVKEWVKLCNAKVELKDYYNKATIDEKLSEQSTRIVEVKTTADNNKTSIVALETKAGDGLYDETGAIVSFTDAITSDREAVASAFEEVEKTYIKKTDATTVDVKNETNSVITLGIDDGESGHDYTITANLQIAEFNTSTNRWADADANKPATSHQIQDMVIEEIRRHGGGGGSTTIDSKAINPLYVESLRVDDVFYITHSLKIASYTEGAWNFEARPLDVEGLENLNLATAIDVAAADAAVLLQANTYVDNRIGDIGEGKTVKNYFDTYDTKIQSLEEAPILSEETLTRLREEAGDAFDTTPYHFRLTGADLQKLYDLLQVTSVVEDA